jgi:hypothetical protein
MPTAKREQRVLLSVLRGEHPISDFRLLIFDFKPRTSNPPMDGFAVANISASARFLPSHFWLPFLLNS